MFKTVTLFLIVFFIISCNDIKAEKDKHPEIPEFPKFKNGNLKLVKKIELIAKTDSTKLFQEEYYMHERFLVKDSTFFLITFLTDGYDVKAPYPGRKYDINLITIKNGKINHHNWVDNDFKINFDIDKNNYDLTIGKRKYFAKSNYLKYDSISNFNDSKSVDTIFDDDIFFNNFNDQYLSNNNFYKPTSFDKIIVDSKATSTAAENSAISVLSWKYIPIYLDYYRVKYKNKIGLTKVIDDNAPIFIKLKDELYYINSEYIEIKDNERTDKIKIYQIQ